jgi:hypothetical protein
VPNTANSGDVVITFPATTDVQAAKVTDLILAGKVPAPVTGGAPATFFSATQYTGAAAWTNVTDGNALHTGAFIAGKVYKAEVTLTAVSGYTFNGIPAAPAQGSFTHTGASSVSSTANSGDVVITFPATTGVATVTDLFLTYNVPAPVLGGTPVSSFAGPQYIGTVAWKRTDNSAAHSGVFAADTAYTATVTLTAASGWTFDGLGDDAFSHQGLPAATVTNAANTGVVTIKFPATTAVMPATVTELSLTYNIPTPARDGTPVTSFTGLQYYGVVDWKRTDTGAAHSGIFQPTTAYTAEVKMLPVSGYTFTGVAANAFSHGAPGATVTNAAGTGVVTIKFPATSAAPLTTVTDLWLSYNVPAPIVGGTPVTSFTGWQYYGAVDWFRTGDVEKHTSLFQPNTAYTAKVTMLPVAGYTFAGVAVDAFKHAASGATVTNGANSGVVTIVFPATAGVTVTDKNLSAYVPAPVAGKTPVMSFAGPQYTGAAAWSKTAGGAHTGAFQAETEYTATITLTAKTAEDWTFDGVGADSFTHGTLSPPSITNPAGAASAITVTILFPKTGKNAATDVEVEW